jgi:uncharacterized protein (TIGR03083 family)
MDTAAVYSGSRQRLLELCFELTAEDAAAVVAPTPAWRVRDIYAHLAGVCADTLDGRMDGAGSPEWTAAQVESRRPAGIEGAAQEWEARAPELDALLRSADPGAMTFVAFDTWTHEQDVRAALGWGRLDDGFVPELAESALDVFDGRFRAAGTPALLVVTERRERVLGDGEPDATLTMSSYEWLRMVFGRRSLHQIQAANWECEVGAGGPDAFIGELHLFALPASDIDD